MPDFVDSIFNAVAVTSNSINSSAKSIASSIKDAMMVTGDTITNYTPTQISSSVSSILNSESPLKGSSPPPSMSLSGLLSVGIQQLHDFYGNNQELTKIALFTMAPIILKKAFTHPVRRALRLPAPTLSTGTTRFEVILLLASPDSPFVSKLIHDLNKRGYVVYVTVDNERELQMIENMNDSDIRHLWIDWTSTSTIKSSLLKLAKILDSPINSTNGITSPDEYFYNFKAVLFAPSYNHMPKSTSITELSTKEVERVIELHFAKLNSLLHNGLSSIISESNNRREEVWEVNRLSQKLSDKPIWKTVAIKLNEILTTAFFSYLGLSSILSTGGVSKGGATKLIWLNFMVQYSAQPVSESGYEITSSAYVSSLKSKAVTKLIYAMNSAYFKILHSELAPSVFESLSRRVGIINNPFQIDMAMVSIDIIKGHGGLIKYKNYDAEYQQKDVAVFGKLNTLASHIVHSVFSISSSIGHYVAFALGKIFDCIYDSICSIISIFDINTNLRKRKRRRGVNPRRVHYLVFDLINSTHLSSEYWIS